ncbi:MAG: hypothetical protein AAB457_01315 [Patescibacteria group bacterium]
MSYIQRRGDSDEKIQKATPITVRTYPMGQSRSAFSITSIATEEKISY